MKLLTKLTLILLLFTVSFASYGQENPEEKAYPSLLWEITGNGLNKPSYLFGTMHVSAKMAFYLSDSFFTALKSVDVVGLESRPDEWLPNMVDLGLMSAYTMNSRNPYNYSNYNSFGDVRFRLSKGNVDDLKSGIAQNHPFINALLYRSNAGMQEFEERTYLDLFIFQTGMKLNKELISLEDYATSLSLVSQATEDYFTYSYDEDEFEPASMDNTDRYGMGNYKAYELLEDAYRRGDLDVIDSIDQIMYTGKSRKYMLLDRNDLIVIKADSIMKKRSLFIAVGAAHLPGEGGIIELLRARGYTVRPVMQKGRDEKSRNKFEKIQVTHPAQAFISKDSLFRADFPGRAIETEYLGGSNAIVYPDMVNGAYYIVSRTAYHRTIWNESAEYVLERIDSFLYEFVPGDIIKKTSITLSGYPGFDILNKTRSGDFQRSRILVLPNEIILIKLSGKGDYAKSKQVDNFFKSVQIRPNTSAWRTIEDKDTRLSFEFPGTPNRNFLPNTEEAISSRRDYVLSGSEKDNVYFVLNQPYDNNSPFVNDTAQLRFALTSFKSTGKISCLKSAYIDTANLFLLDWTAQWDSTPLRIRAVKQGGGMVIYGVLIRQNNADVERFLASIKSLPILKEEFEVVHDSTVFASYKGPKSPTYPFIQQMMAMRNQFKWNGGTSTITNRGDAESINLAITYPDVYEELYDTSDYFSSLKNWKGPENDLYIVSIGNEVQRGKYVSKDFRYTDTGSSNCWFVRDMWSPEASYQISFIYDTLSGMSHFASSVLNSFQPFDSVPHQGIAVRGKAKFWSDINSSDTVLVQSAINRLNWVEWGTKDIPQLVAMLDTAKASKALRVKLRAQIGSTKSESSLNYYLAKYEAVGDTSTMQVKALEYIFSQASDTAFKKGSEILANRPPLPGSSSAMQSVFREIRDSLELAVLLVPDLLKLTDFEEYEDHVFRVLAALADSGLVDKGLVSYPLDDLLRKANTELRRINSSAEKEVEDDYYSYYGASAPQNRFQSDLSRYLHALYPYKNKNKEVADLLEKARLAKDESFLFDLLKLKYEKEKLVDTLIVNKLVLKEDYRFELCQWLLEKKQINTLPSAYKTQDSLLKPMLKYVQLGQGNEMDSVVWLKKDRVYMGADSGYLHYYRIYNSNQETWQYGCLALLPLENGELPKDVQAFTNLGTWNKDDNVDEKIFGFSEILAIDYYDGFFGSNSYEDSYEYDYSEF